MKIPKAVAKSLNLYRPLLLILSLFAAFKLFFLLKYHLPIWDEAVYLGMGKYIYSLGTVGIWENIRPIGLPLVSGFFWRLGLPQIPVTELFTVLSGAGCIGLTYLIAKKIFNGKIAVLAALLLASSPVFFLYSSYILTEVPSTFFALLAIYAFIKGRYLTSGFAAAAAMLFKFPHGLLVPVFALAVLVPLLSGIKNSGFSSLKQLKPLVSLLAAFLAGTLPFLILNYGLYRSYTSSLSDAVLRPFILGSWHQSNPSKMIANSLYNYFFYAVEALKQHLAFVLLIAAVFIFLKRRWFEDRAKLVVASYFLLYSAYFTYIANKDGRFLILFLPAVCIFSAAAFFEVFSRLRQQLSAAAAKKRMQKYVLRLAVVAVASLLMLSFAVAILQDGYSTIYWRSNAEPEVASQLYKGVSNFGIKGAVLTSEPVFAAFNDNLFVWYYYTSYNGVPQEVKSSNEWERDKPFEAVIFTPSTLFCPAGDFECEAAKANMYAYLQSNFKEVFNGTYYDGLVDYYVFVNASVYKGAVGQYEQHR